MAGKNLNELDTIGGQVLDDSIMFPVSADGITVGKNTIGSIRKPYLKEEYYGENVWYRIYENGWVEQGGFVYTAATSVTFIKPFLTIFSLSVTPLSRVTEYENFYVYDVTATGFSLAAKHVPSAHAVTYYACGKVEQ